MSTAGYMLDMSSEFGKHAFVSDEARMGAEERTVRTLDGTLPANVPPLKLGTINNISRARIRRDFAAFLAGNLGSIQGWLTQVAEGRPPTYRDGADGKPQLVDAGAKPNPGYAIELLLNVAEFSTPRLKAVALEVSDKGGALKRLTVAELQDKIVSEQ